jgi:hypothetical protein
LWNCGWKVRCIISDLKFSFWIALFEHMDLFLRITAIREGSL